MFWNNWRKPWWITFGVVWVGMLALLLRYEVEPQSAARIALVIAIVAAIATWGVLQRLRRPPP